MTPQLWTTTSLMRKGVFNNCSLQFAHTKHSAWKHLSSTLASDDSIFERQCWQYLDIVAHYYRWILMVIRWLNWSFIERFQMMYFFFCLFLVDIYRSIYPSYHRSRIWDVHVHLMNFLLLEGMGLVFCLFSEIWFWAKIGEMNELGKQTILYCYWNLIYQNTFPFPSSFVKYTYDCMSFYPLSLSLDQPQSSQVSQIAHDLHTFSQRATLQA